MRTIKGKMCELFISDGNNIYWRNREGFDELIHPSDYDLIITTLNLNSKNVQKASLSESNDSKEESR